MRLRPVYLCILIGSRYGFDNVFEISLVITNSRLTAFVRGRRCGHVSSGPRPSKTHSRIWEGIGDAVGKRRWKI